MKLALSLFVSAACALFVGCGSDGGATSSAPEDDAQVPLGDGTLDETSTPMDSAASETTADSASPGDTAVADSAMTSDGATTDGGTSNACGSATCSGATPVCCAGSAGTSCVAMGASCPTGQAKFSCTSPSGCPSGQVCCASGAAAGGASCTATCPTTVICASNADCKGGTTCKPFVAGIKACIK